MEEKDCSPTGNRTNNKPFIQLLKRTSQFKKLSIRGWLLFMDQFWLKLYCYSKVALPTVVYLRFIPFEFTTDAPKHKTMTNKYKIAFPNTGTLKRDISGRNWARIKDITTGIENINKFNLINKKRRENFNQIKVFQWLS